MIKEDNIITAGVAAGHYDITAEDVKAAVREELTAHGFQSRYMAAKHKTNPDDKIVKRSDEYHVMTADEYTIFKKAEQKTLQMSEGKMSVLLVEPNQYPKRIEIADKLEELQRAVGGYIETVPLALKGKAKVELVLNEEGKLLGLPKNRCLRDSNGNPYDTIVGSFLVVGVKGENFCSLSESQLKEYEQLFHRPEAFMQIGRTAFVFPVLDEYVGKDVPVGVNIPVYRQSLQSAEAYGQVPEYTLSFQANKLCKQRIEAIIKENYDGSHLNPQGAKQIVHEFGVKRVEYVLASTVQVKEWDGRFSPSNKSWANSVFSVSDMRNGVDRRMDYAVQSHPAVLDGFIGQVREEIKAMEPKAPSLNERLEQAKDAVAKQDTAKNTPEKKHELSL